MHGHRSTETPGDSLESASRKVNRSLRPNGEASEEEWAAARRSETEALFNWAEEEGLILPLASVDGRANYTGMEHSVWFDEDFARWFKRTRCGEFGKIPELEYEIDKVTQRWVRVVLLRAGTPGEYLQRLRLGRDLFGDAFDAQARNFLRSRAAVLPIDLILTPTEGSLKEGLAAAITQ